MTGTAIELSEAGRRRMLALAQSEHESFMLWAQLTRELIARQIGFDTDQVEFDWYLLPLRCGEAVSLVLGAFTAYEALGLDDYKEGVAHLAAMLERQYAILKELRVGLGPADG